eukprot:357211-Chlamydomonas_euryale.AAC.7
MVNGWLRSGLVSRHGGNAAPPAACGLVGFKGWTRRSCSLSSPHVTREGRRTSLVRGAARHS